MTIKLIDKTGREIAIGDKITCFRGEHYTVTGWPQTGRNRVWVRAEGETHDDEYYPQVFDLTLA